MGSWTWLKEMVIDLANYGVPLIALALSMYSVRESRKNSKLQSRLGDLEEKLKKIELNEKEMQIEDSKKSCVEARVYKISQGNYKLKIWNSGKATAYNIDFHTDEGFESGVYKQYTPYEFLESGKSFEEITMVHNGTSNKFPLTTIWKDEDGNDHSKRQIITI